MSVWSALVEVVPEFGDAPSAMADPAVGNQWLIRGVIRDWIRD